MTQSKRTLWLALMSVAAAQILFLSWMVWDRINTLHSGREITLKVIPIDPRDIFRGDYVVLGYDMSRIVHSTATDGPLPPHLVNGADIYVTLTPDAERGWKVLKSSNTYPASVSASDVVVRGRITYVWEDPADKTTHFSVEYGIENYFVPENTGRALEEQVREKKIEAVVAVGSGGEAALKALAVDGARIHEQPLL